MIDYCSNHYPRRKIGGGNPYYCCADCGISDPQINGNLYGHADFCDWANKEKAAIKLASSLKFNWEEVVGRWDQELELGIFGKLTIEDNGEGWFNCVWYDKRGEELMTIPGAETEDKCKKEAEKWLVNNFFIRFT